MSERLSIQIADAVAQAQAQAQAQAMEEGIQDAKGLACERYDNLPSPPSDQDVLDASEPLMRTALSGIPGGGALYDIVRADMLKAPERDRVAAAQSHLRELAKVCADRS